MNDFDTFILLKDLNPVIKKGMKGVILEVYNDHDIEVEFLTSDGKNYEYNGDVTFCINTRDIAMVE